MKSKYIKIGIFFLLFITIAIINSSIRLQLFGAGIEKNEILSGKIISEINSIFYQEKAIKIDSLMNSITSRYRFNGNVLVSYKGECIFNKPFGYSDVIRREKLTNESVYQLASVSKQFTAMAIMILKERNQLNYDDSVTKYIPDFPYKGITIRMLLNHTSGLPNYMWLVDNYWKSDKVPYNDDIIKLLANYKLELYFTPGRKFNYSNTGYIVLASVVEKISGIAFSKFMDEEIFEPLDMRNTFVYSCLEKNSKDKLCGFAYRGKKYRLLPETVNDGSVGDKGVYSTTEDLFKWDQALYSNELVSYETLNEALSGFKIRDKYDIPYGFGFRITNKNDKKVVYHHGRWNGFRTSIYRYIEDRNTVIVLNNTSSAFNSTIIRGIQDILYDSTETDITHDIVNTIITSGVESAIDMYNLNKPGKKIVLDTLKISKTYQLLNNSDKPEIATKLKLFKEMYVKGELASNKMNEKNFFELITLNDN